MTHAFPTKRRRGGQPGNQNARANKGGAPRGNKNALNNNGGAPHGNRNACKRPRAPHLILLEDYKNSPPDIISWIEANAEALDEANFTDDNQHDRALFAAYRGLTIDAIIKTGKEYQCGFYSLIEVDFDQQAIPAMSVVATSNSDLLSAA